VPDTGANGTETGQSTVSVHKYGCGQEYPESGSVDDWRLACSNSQSGSGYEFTLIDNAGYSETLTTDESGTVSWTGTPFGELSFTETPAPGYRTGTVFCGSAQPGTEPDPVTPEAVQDGKTSGFDRQDGYNVVCAWFNIPAQPATIHIYKYFCDPGYDESSLSKEHLEGYCSPKANVSFEAYGSSGDSYSDVTDVSGHLFWEDVPYSVYDLYESEREG
jgi:hypothetical protein